MSFKNIYKKSIQVMVVLILMTSSLFTIHADAYEDFSIRAVIPDNQNNDLVEYFDLRVEPSQKQTIAVDITNRGNEDMVAHVVLNNATTGNNAEKNFSTALTPDESLIHPLTSVASVRDERIIIKANETVQAYIDITIPETSFDGVILGGVGVIADTLVEKNDKKKDDQSITLNKRISYVIAVQMSMNDTPIERNLNLTKTGSKLVAFKPAFIATIQNDRPILMNIIDINGTINKRGKSETVATARATGSGITPNSNFDAIFELEKTKIEPGEYDMHLRITHEDRVWEWNEIVVIDATDAKKLNDQIKFTGNEDNTIMFLILGILFLILILLLLLIMKRRKREEEEKSAK